MPAAYYEGYPTKNYSSNNYALSQKEEETQAASLLLMLGRSVTPEPQASDDSDLSRKLPSSTSYPSQSSYASYEYNGSDNRRSAAQHYGERAASSTMTPVVSVSSSSLVNKREVSDSSLASTVPKPISFSDADYKALVEDSKLIYITDRDLVPDSLFVAMAQMTPCSVTHVDRVGCYKSREVGFLGMCCKHCGGQPGFGRYFPNSVRSLAQTTTSQTILKHIGNKCRFCPPEIRAAVLQLQQQLNLCEGTSSGRPRYGSRKIFFQRVWKRLHGSDAVTGNDDDSASTESTPNMVDETTSTASTSDAEEHQGKRKSRFGLLPTQRNAKKAKSGLPQMPH